MTTYASEPGTRLGGRYRLEDRIAAGSGWAAWKAIDETLARAVTVFTFAAGFPRVNEVVTAARAASRLTDPRVAQVFDVEDTWDRAYIVMEWAAGETLGDLLSQGPLEPGRAARMIADAAAAIGSAHAAGVAHMCLSPGSVRWSPTGEVKVVGLGLDAALSGVSADDPVLADTRGLGRLLYAALTGCWPGADYPSLPAAPLTNGQPCSPRQVVAGVPLSLSDLAVAAMEVPAGHGAQPVTTPSELSRALLAAAPPVPLGPAQPNWRDKPIRHGGTASGQTRAAEAPAGRPGGAGRAGTDRPGGSGYIGDTWPPGGPGRAGEPGQPGRRRADRPAQRRKPAGPLPVRASKGVILSAVGVLAVAALAAFILLDPHGPGANNPKGKTTPSVAAVPIVTPVWAKGFDPLTSPAKDPGDERTAHAKNAIDGNPATAWASQWYSTPEFGLLKAGSGLIINMGKPVRFSSVTVTFDSEPGAQVKLLTGNSAARSKANLDSMTTIASASSPTGTYTFRITGHVVGQYLVIWYSRLAPSPTQKGTYQAVIYNVLVRGTT
jgi:hypothetical protein